MVPASPLKLPILRRADIMFVVRLPCGPLKECFHLREGFLLQETIRDQIAGQGQNLSGRAELHGLRAAQEARRPSRGSKGRLHGAGEDATPLSMNAYKLCSRNLCGGQFSKPLTGVKLQSAYSGEEVNMLSRREATAGLIASAALVAAPKFAAAQERKPIELPPPRTEGGMPLMSALKARHSTRAYFDRPLPPQMLSDLLWAAFGINRPSGDRTAPYWRHIMVIDVYAAMADGVWLYEPKSHTLLPYLAADIRTDTGLQDFVGKAPLNLVYVAHGERMRGISPEDRRLYASVDTGFIGQNVYLFCASEGLATVFRGAVDYRKLDGIMNLPEEQFVTFAQTVGYPHE